MKTIHYSFLPIHLSFRVSFHCKSIHCTHSFGLIFIIRLYTIVFDLIFIVRLNTIVLCLIFNVRPIVFGLIFIVKLYTTVFCLMFIIRAYTVTSVRPDFYHKSIHYSFWPNFHHKTMTFTWLWNLRMSQQPEWKSLPDSIKLRIVSRWWKCLWLLARLINEVAMLFLVNLSVMSGLFLLRRE